MQLISISRKVESINLRKSGKSLQVRPAKFRSKEEKGKILQGHFAGKAVHVGTEGKVAYFFANEDSFPIRAIAGHVAKEPGATEYVIVNIGDDAGVTMTDGLRGMSNRDIWAAMGRLIHGQITTWYLCIVGKIVFIKRKLRLHDPKYAKIAAIITGLNKPPSDGPRPSPSELSRKPIE